MYGKTFDVLLGRRTYDVLANYWPKTPKSPMADRLNAATKFVITHRPESLEWGPFEAIGPDLVDSVRRIKAKNGPDLVLPVPTWSTGSSHKATPGPNRKSLPISRLRRTNQISAFRWYGMVLVNDEPLACSFLESHCQPEL
jgi:hypothetical protein